MNCGGYVDGGDYSGGGGHRSGCGRDDNNRLMNGIVRKMENKITDCFVAKY